MEVHLVMVGGPKSHKGKNVRIKGIQFHKGEAVLRGSDEHVGSLCKYLRGFGAVQKEHAAAMQAEIDKRLRENTEGDKISRRLQEAEMEAFRAHQELKRAEQRQAESNSYGSVSNTKSSPEGEHKSEDDQKTASKGKGSGK